MPTATLSVEDACNVLGVTTSDAWSDVTQTYLQRSHHIELDSPPAQHEAAKDLLLQLTEAFERLLRHHDSHPYAFPEKLPEDEYVTIEGVVAWIRYRSEYGFVEAILELNIEDVFRLQWFPEPSHKSGLNSVHVMRDGKMVTKDYPFSIQEFRSKFREWEVRDTAQAKAAELEKRLPALTAAYQELHDKGLPTNRLIQELSAARAHLSALKGYKPPSSAQAEASIAAVEREIERVSVGGSRIIVDDLIEGVLYHSDHVANQHVIDEVRSWSIRTGGFIEPITEAMLRKYYSRRINTSTMYGLQLTNLALHATDYAPWDVLEELQRDGQVAPDHIELNARRGTARYEVKYDFIEKDGQSIPVGRITIPLSTYDRTGHDYGKSSDLPTLPHDIQLMLDVTVDGVVIAHGFDDDLVKKITKYKRSRNRSKTIEGTDEFGLRRYAPIQPSDLPPWYKGSRLRW